MPCDAFSGPLAAELFWDEELADELSLCKQLAALKAVERRRLCLRVWQAELAREKMARASSSSGFGGQRQGSAVASQHSPQQEQALQKAMADAKREIAVIGALPDKSERAKRVKALRVRCRRRPSRLA